MKYLAISIPCILLLAVSAFCGFGFLATFEPLENQGLIIGLRLGYALIGSAAILGMVLLIAKTYRFEKKEP